MTQEIVRALVNGVWVTEVASQGGGGGGGVTEITSTDMSVTITDPTGPTVDLSVSGGSQPVGALSSKEFLFTEEATAENVTFPITAADTGGQVFTVAGDHVGDFFGSASFTVVGSTGNDGLYTVSSVTLDAGNTLVGVSETVADDTADGDITFGRYIAEFEVAEGIVLDDIRLYILEEWAAPLGGGQCAFFMGDLDDPVGFYGDFDILSGASYDPRNLQDNSFVSLREPLAFVSGGGTFSASGVFGLFSNKTVRNSAGTGTTPAMGSKSQDPGFRYPEASTITATLITALSTTPVTPTGLFLVKIIYFAFQTPTDATF